MKITDKEIERLASLARLSFEGEEKERIKKDLNAIVNYVEQLRELDDSNVEPTSRVIEFADAMRKDEPKPSMTREEALANAAARTEDFVKVPKILSE